jgi:hypothetical protein
MDAEMSSLPEKTTDKDIVNPIFHLNTLHNNPFIFFLRIIGILRIAGAERSFYSSVLFGFASRSS